MNFPRFLLSRVHALRTLRARLGTVTCPRELRIPIVGTCGALGQPARSAVLFHTHAPTRLLVHTHTRARTPIHAHAHAHEHEHARKRTHKLTPVRRLQHLCLCRCPCLCLYLLLLLHLNLNPCISISIRVHIHIRLSIHISQKIQPFHIHPAANIYQYLTGEERAV